MSEKITALTELASGSIVDADPFVAVDISDTTMAPSGTNKKFTWGSLKTALSSLFASSAQGALADSATQPGDNVSTLTNDAGYITSAAISGKADKTITFSAGTGLTGGGDLSANRSYALSAGSIASLALADSATQPGDNVSTLTNDAGYTTNTGTVTSVGLSVPTGFTVANSPVTGSATLAVSYDTGYVGYTTTEQTKLSGIETGADVTDATNVAAAGAVMTSGNQTIADVKTFSSSPVTPSSAPTTDYQVANKKYVDDNGGGGGVAGNARFRVYKTSDQSVAGSTETTVVWGAEEYDNTNIFASNAATIPSGEGWMMYARIQSLDSSRSMSMILRIKDGATILREISVAIRSLTATDDYLVAFAGVVVGTGNALTVTFEHTDSVSRDIKSGSTQTEWGAFRVW